MDLGFEGKVVLVTGAASGVGASVARKLAEEGAQVAIADFNETGAIRLAGEIGRGARAYPIDVADAAAVQAIVARIEDELGNLTLAVNNAGIGEPLCAAADQTVAAWQRTLDVNLSGIFYGLKAQIPALLAHGGGAIVNTASAMSLVGQRGLPAYTAAKHGVAGLTRAAAPDYATQNIRINAVAPGYLATPMLVDNLDAEGIRSAEALHPLNRLGHADEIADAILFLLSDRASFITGVILPVDGGYTAR